jgi:hypothetical protein
MAAGIRNLRLSHNPGRGVSGEECGARKDRPGVPSSFNDASVGGELCLCGLALPWVETIREAVASRLCPKSCVAVHGFATGYPPASSFVLSTETSLVVVSRFQRHQHFRQ